MECLIGAGVKQFVKVNAGENALSQLSTMMKNASGSSSWLFGHLGYDLKNDIENLTSSNPDEAEFDDLYFFIPEVVIRINENELWIEAANANAIAAEIESIVLKPSNFSNAVTFTGRLTKEAYIQKITLLKQHILRAIVMKLIFVRNFLLQQLPSVLFRFFKNYQSFRPIHLQHYINMITNG
jgi:para-aminobenzoate synthetase component 1